MYSGNHGPCHPLHTRLAAAEHLKQNSPPTVFCFVGGGSETTKVKDFVRARNLRNVLCLPYQPVEKLGASLSAADLHVVVMGDPFVGTIRPCKIYNILRLGTSFLYVDPQRSHVTDMLPRGAVGDWAHVFHHGEIAKVAMCINRCDEEGAGHSEQEMALAREFSSQQLIPHLMALLKQGVGQYAPGTRAAAARTISRIQE